MRYIAISINVGIYVTRPNVQLGICKYGIIAFIISWLSVSHAGIKPKNVWLCDILTEKFLLGRVWYIFKDTTHMPLRQSC